MFVVFGALVEVVGKVLVIIGLFCGKVGEVLVIFLARARINPEQCW